MILSRRCDIACRRSNNTESMLTPSCPSRLALAAEILRPVNPDSTLKLHNRRPVLLALQAPNAARRSVRPSGPPAPVPGCSSHRVVSADTEPFNDGLHNQIVSYQNGLFEAREDNVNQRRTRPPAIVAVSPPLPSSPARLSPVDRESQC